MKKKKIVTKRIKGIKRSPKPSHNFKNIFIGILILGAIAYFAISRIPKQVAEPIGINEIAPSTQTVELFLPASISVTPGSETTIDLIINTGGAQVTVAQVELTYDQSKLGTPILNQGDFLTDKLGNPQIDNGRIAFVYAIPLGSEGKSGEGKLATIKFTPSANSQITFSNNTMIAASGIDSNVLKSATGTTILTNPASTPPPAPPALTDIQQPTPAEDQPTSRPTSTQANPSPIQNIPPTQSNTEPVQVNYRPEQDYDYSQTSEEPTIENVSTDTGFARFLKFMKQIFRSQQQ